MPDTLINLKQLNSLSIQHTRITNMTEQLANLRHLRSLSLVDCSLTRLPNLDGLQNLYQVQVQNNRLSQIDGLNGPGYLYLDRNLFTNLPVVTGSDNVHTLSMSHNPLKHVMQLSLFSGLQYLHLRNITISSIPPMIDKLKNLYYLDLSDNKLVYLPKNILKLANLRHLYLQRNLFPTDELTTIRREFNTSMANCSLSL